LDAREDSWLSANIAENMEVFSFKDFEVVIKALPVKHDLHPIVIENRILIEQHIGYSYYGYGCFVPPTHPNSIEVQVFPT